MPVEPEIAVADAEPRSAEHIASALRQDGNTVTVVPTGRALLELVAGGQTDLAVVDLALPDRSGTDVLRSVRSSHPSLPVVLVSSVAEEIDRVVAFELGADDFVEKPLSPRELSLRVRAILRRRALRDGTVPPSRIAVGPIEIHPERHETRVAGRRVALTPLELRLLSYLATRAGRVITREALLDDVWGSQTEPLSRIVDTTIKRLRKRLGGAGARIETVRGVGYRLRE